ncbi:MAG: cytochrome c-type biogenesis protein CcmH [Solirubrobacterales bacterium]
MRRLALRFTAGLLVLSMALAPAAGATGATPKVGIADIEDEVMCPVCGTLLELAESPQALREKAFVARLIAAGRTRAEIKDALVAQYGRSVLALPEGRGFDLSAYLVPVIAFGLAVVALAVGVWRWRDGGGDSKPDGPTGPRGEEAERLDADIARYDL